MTSEHSSAIRFVLPRFDTATQPAGFCVSVQGGLEKVQGRDAIRQALRLLLTTLPGERVMRPTYGCALDQLLFELNDDTTAGLALHFVRQAIALWEPRVEIVHLDATSSESDPHRLDIHLEYRVIGSRLRDHLHLAVPLREGPR